MASAYEEENLELQILTKEYVAELIRIWKHLFEPETCKSNLERLKEHARAFYQDLVSESLDRQNDLEQEIAGLKEEASQLSRLLKLEFEFPALEEDDSPLIVVQSNMDASLAELRNCLKKRQEEIYDLLLEQENLCEQLDEVPKELLADPLPSAEEIEDFQFHLEELKILKVQRMDEMSAMRRDIKGFMKTLMAKPCTSEDLLLNCREMKLDKGTLNALKDMYDRYKGEVDEIVEKIDIMRQKVDVLWNRLGTSPSSRKKVSKHCDYNMRTFEVLSEEVQRLEELKRQNVKLFVEQVRGEIRIWWVKNMKSEAEQMRFSSYTSNCYTDDLLELHEIELEELKTHYTTNQRIFELYEERKTLWDRMVALEAKENEPGRYKNRGGQLLKEEKERKTIATKLPKIEYEIEKLVKDYEANERKPFLVYGENILDVIAEDWERKRMEKEQLTSARKNAVTPAKNNSNLIKRTPLSMKNTFSTTRTTPIAGAATTGKSVIGTSMAYLGFTSSKKRKMLSSNKNSPSAKRSLMTALTSPSCATKPRPMAMTPSTSKTPGSSSFMFKTPKPGMTAGTTNKTPNKRAKVIATTIKRYSNGAKKRKSLGKRGTNNYVVPKVVIHNSTGDASEFSSAAEESYDCFKESIPSNSRSSTLASSNHHELQNQKPSGSGKRKIMPSMIEDTEEPTLWNLPTPVAPRTPAEHNVSCSRRRVGKNIPILL